MPSFNVQDSVAFVTGTNKPSGIGHAIVEALFKHGAAKVYATARHAEMLDDLVALHPAGKVIPVALDVTDLDAMAALGEKYPDVTIVVSNAGYNAVNSATGDIEKATDELKINYIAPMAIGKSFAPVFAKLTSTSDDVKPSALVNVNSMLGLVAIPVNSTYCASKAAAHALTQGQRSDLKNSSLVIGVYPGAVETDMTKGMPYEKGTPDGLAEMLMEALQQGTEDIYPDPMAIQMHEGWKADAKQMERNMSQYAAH